MYEWPSAAKTIANECAPTADIMIEGRSNLCREHLRSTALTTVQLKVS